MRRSGLCVLTCLVMFAAAEAAAQTAARPAAKPNIILIVADDLGYGDLGSYGQTIIQTPHLDRLAAEGVRFTQFYAGSTVCAPSRSVLMTGQHTGHTRVRGNAGAGNYAPQTLAAGDVTVARVLRQAGYATALIGKWGLGEIESEGEPNRHGFEYFFGFVNQAHAHNHYPDFLWRNTAKIALPNVVTPVGSTPGAGYATRREQYAGDLFFDEARAFIERSKGRPFFLELALTVPHANNERARALGDGQEVPGYGPYASKAWADPLKGQAAMITRMDRQIGDLMAQLKQLGLDSRTLVMFTSDNGPHKEGGLAFDPDFFDANGPFSGIKRSLTDGGIRVPFLARWPGTIAAGRTSADVGYFGDVMATLCELTGVARPPAATDSLSLVPALTGRGIQAAHEYLYWEFYEGGFSQAVLLEGRWKGIRLKSPASSIQLFDLATDIAEAIDLAARQPDLVRRIEGIMRSAHVDNEHWKWPAAAPRQEQSVEVWSPDGKTVLTVGVQEQTDGHCGYALSRDGRVILRPSTFGLTFRGELPFGQHVRVSGVTRSRSASRWNPLYGERHTVPDAYNQVTITCAETRPPHRAVELTFRAYDEGVAFQYVVLPSEGRAATVLVGEHSRFVFEQDYPAWVTPTAQGRYERLPISSMGADRERPLVVEMGAGLYAAFGEAKLVDYARMKLSAAAGPAPAMASSLSGEVELALPAVSPWRYVMIGASPAQLLERNYLLLNLNDPPAAADLSWIKPGKVIREVTLTTQGGLASIDFAAARGLQYVEFDAGWYGPEDSDASSALAVNVDPKRSAGPLDLPRVIQYAASRNIGVILYVNRRALERQLDDILPLYASWGVKGIKFGFVRVGSQPATRWLHDAVRKAAAHRLMMDVHDEYRPTGYERTYPNLMTVEGIRGDEESPDNRHTLTTLFTRMLAGPGDNTICYFAPRVRSMGSHASQLAKAVLLYSPWQFLYWYDRPAGSPRRAGGAGSSDGVIGDEPELEFFDALPVTWDETRVLEGAIGEYATIARRKGREWFVASLTGEQGRALEVPLSFLDKNVEYTATLYVDDGQVQTRTGVGKEVRRVSASTVLRQALGGNQGLAVILRQLPAAPAASTAAARALRPATDAARIDAAVDSRVEFLSAVARTAGFDEYRRPLASSPYSSRVDALMAPHAGHRAFERMRAPACRSTPQHRVGRDDCRGLCTPPGRRSGG